ncbi:hypothetical protein LR48_Vigan01g216700 [Vigna angularis]|uniref:Uncharacterized protein n=1 Tax=Phaseolus angularis TaxID=3914 RepID=A0A0L9TQ57_PHAAN|nr:hypothetical protein LR48_Vigan01g216700 [Vigna angularis]
MGAGAGSAPGLELAGAPPTKGRWSALFPVFARWSAVSSAPAADLADWTAKVVIHVEEGTVKLKDQDEEVTFNVFGVEQQNHEKETSLEATDELLSITSLTEQAAKLVKKSLSCLSPRVKGEEEEKEEELVHQNSTPYKRALERPFSCFRALERGLKRACC